MELVSEREILEKDQEHSFKRLRLPSEVLKWHAAQRNSYRNRSNVSYFAITNLTTIQNMNIFLISVLDNMATHTG